MSRTCACWLMALLLALLTGCSLLAPPAPVTATASSERDGEATSALVDADVGSRSTGSQWAAAIDDTDPWVQLDFTESRRVASVQIFGPDGRTALAQLHGVLSFSDGSSVPVAAIDGGDGPATLVAFAPRDTDWVRLELSRTEGSAQVALREVAVYDAGQTPPRWPDRGATFSVTPPGARCDAAVAATKPVADVSPGELSLACPAPGTAVHDNVTVVLRGDPGREVELQGLRDAYSAVSAERSRAVTLASGVVEADGMLTAEVDLTSLPPGPVTLRAQAADRSGAAPLYVQLIHIGGQAQPNVSSVSHQPLGSTLQWAEEFDDPLSVSGTGEGATYAASKPERQGASQFGDAVFADPDAGAGALATIPGGFLRVRAQPIGDVDVNADAGQESLTGFLSSSRVGGGGFSAQYGYFEARMMGGPGTGTWPAFWALDSEAATPRQQGAGEIDIVELYGHSTLGSCHTIHDWGQVADESTAPACVDPNGHSDWAMSWHVYGAQVTPSETIFTIDGVEVARRPAISKQDSPYFFMIDLALGGGWPVDLSRTGGVSDLYVDWVRVFT